jgi:hypothetical protein
MADTTGSNGTSSNTFDWGKAIGALGSIGDDAVKGYFASQAVKNTVKAPPTSAAIVVGGIVALAVVFLIALKH